MSGRPSFQELYMQLAMGMASRSTCARLQVGCVITSIDYRQVLAVGYNGNAAGLANGCDSEEPGKCGCLHAEDNAVINCRVARGEPKIVFVTHSPCVMCAKRFINLGDVVTVIFGQQYRSNEGAGLLVSAGIQLFKSI